MDQWSKLQDDWSSLNSIRDMIICKTYNIQNQFHACVWLYETRVYPISSSQSQRVSMGNRRGEIKAKLACIKAPASPTKKNKIKSRQFTDSTIIFAQYPLMQSFILLALGVVVMRHVAGTVLIHPDLEVRLCRCCGVDECTLNPDCWGPGCPPSSSL
jgi:hypothetical protein